jgi:hypothetical protein
MGVSTTPAQLSNKLDRLAREVKDTRRPLTAAAMAAKTAFIAAEPGVVGHTVARGKVNVRYDVRGHIAIVRFTGPAHLALNPTSPHRIEPRRRGRRGRRALTIGDDVVAWANHPGTRGKDPGARRAKAAAAKVAPKAYQRVGIHEPLRRIF